MAAIVRKNLCPHVNPLLQRRCEEMRMLDQKIGVLMKMVLRCSSVSSYREVEARILRVGNQIRSLYAVAGESTIGERHFPGWRKVLAGAEVLLLNISLVKRHATRLKEFASLSARVDEMWKMIARYDLVSEASLDVEVLLDRMRREFTELDLSFISVIGGFRISALLPCQTKPFNSLRERMDVLRDALLDRQILSSNQQA